MLMPAVQLKQVARGLSSYHPGLDLTAPYGSPIRAAMAGTVTFVGTYFGYGRMVDIQHDGGTVTRYAHMSAYAPGLRVGRIVGTGEEIGRVGNSGFAHGAHLHFEVRVNGKPMDPKPYLALAACTVPAHTAIEVAKAPLDEGRPGGLFQ